jgi:hypothetical protein
VTLMYCFVVATNIYLHSTANNVAPVCSAGAYNSECIEDVRIWDHYFIARSCVHNTIYIELLRIIIGHGTRDPALERPTCMAHAQ